MREKISPQQEFFDTTDDTVLGGRLRLRQPKRGHRVGHDAILLAAATEAYPGERVVDLGAGVGAAGLALAARIAGLSMTLIEIDQGLCALAAQNAARNDMAAHVQVLACNVEDKDSLAAAGLSKGSIDRVLMNPPFNDPARQNVSPDPHRRLAHVAPLGLIERWIATAAWLLKPKATLTVIWRAESLDDVIAGLSGEFGDIAILPIYPRAGAPAIRVIVRAVKGGKARQYHGPGLALNDDQGRPTQAAEAVLRGGEALSFQPMLIV